MIFITDESTKVVTIRESPDTEYGDYSPRVTRTATLDGGVVINNSGFSHGDRTLLIRAQNLPISDESDLKAIVESPAIAYVSCREGYFSGAIESMSTKNGILELSFLVKEKLA